MVAEFEVRLLALEKRVEALEEAVKVTSGLATKFREFADELEDIEDYILPVRVDPRDDAELT